MKGGSQGGRQGGRRFPSREVGRLRRHGPSPVRGLAPSLAFRALASLALAPLAGCELQQVTVTEPESVAVAEVYLRVDEGRPDGRVLLHRTFGADPLPPPDARVTLRAMDSGVAARFRPADPSDCLDGPLPQGFRPACQVLDGQEARLIHPGARLELTVEWAEGGILRGSTVVPGDFRLLTPAGLGGDGVGGSCVLPPGRPLLLSWSVSRGVWAYVPEVELRGLREALAPRGIEVRNDPLTLLGLSVSEADTTIVLPGGFGVFNRFAGDREVLVALQAGLPPGPVQGMVVVSAVDRNTTNWNRGGNFNPSGEIRVPSLFGDGTGVVGAVVNRGFTFRVGEDPGGEPTCGLPPPE